MEQPTPQEELRDRVRLAIDKARQLNTANQGRLRHVGQREIVIGIPYPDDGWGKAIQADLDVVALGTQCRVIVIPPGMSLLSIRVDALFFPGGPFDQPGTQGVQGSRFRSPKPGPQEQEAEARHFRELKLVDQAERKNIPILGVCGASRRLATAKGARQVHLNLNEKQHTGNVNDVSTEIRHTVNIAPNTILHRMIATGHYRRISPSEVKGQLNINVNSVHWASSHLRNNSPVEVTARSPGDNVTEGFEDPRYHFQIGVQWHPEYGQLAEGNFKGQAEPHQRIMGGLGDASVDSRAANVTGRAARRFLEKKRAERQLLTPTPITQPPQIVKAVPSQTTVKWSSLGASNSNQATTPAPNSSTALKPPVFVPKPSAPVQAVNRLKGTVTNTMVAADLGLSCRAEDPTSSTSQRSGGGRNRWRHGFLQDRSRSERP